MEIRIRLALSLAMLAGGQPLAAQHSVARSNPFKTAGDLSEGARLFRGQCAACHGPNGAGGAGGPDLRTGAFRRGDSDEALFQLVAKGIPGTAMPAYNGEGRQIWQIVGYVQSLSVGQAAERAKGDAARGEAVFKAHACANCHTIGGSGGAVGPDLTGIGSRRSLGSLQRSILNPDDVVSPDYWTVHARTKSGRQISGIRMNEDTFSIQLRDKNGLGTLLKEDILEHRLVKKSPMPAFQGKPGERDFEDLVAYLAALREGDRP
jgi:cytochrome c oxidase cbb3-type subunit III